MATAPIVHLVDDDQSVLVALGRLLSSAGYRCEGHSTAELFLQNHDPESAGCAILDLEMPDVDGLGIQDRLAARSDHLPVIFLTGHATVPASVRAMKAGAIDFLTKPVDAATLLSAVSMALAKHDHARHDAEKHRDLEQRLAKLTHREKQVLDQVLHGLLNKQIAFNLGIVEKTVKVHRSRVMEKIGVRSIVDLVRTVGSYQS